MLADGWRSAVGGGSGRRRAYSVWLTAALRPCLADPPIEYRPVRIHPPVAQERPIATRLLDAPWIARRHQNRLFGACLGERAPKGIADERVTKELDAIGALLGLEAHAIRRGHEHAVGNGVRTLRRAPRIHLRLAPHCLLRRMPANGRGIKQDVGAKQRRYARGLRIPLVPANQHADGGVAGLPHHEAARLAGRSATAGRLHGIRRLAGREVVLLLE